jgi:hypothetical protein
MIIPYSVADPHHPDPASDFDADPDPSFGCRSGSSLSRSCGCGSGSYTFPFRYGSMRIRIQIHNIKQIFNFFEITAWGHLAPEILLADAPCTDIVVSCHPPDSSSEWPPLLAVHVNIQADGQPGEGGGGPIEQIPRLNEIPAPAPNIPGLFANVFQ